MKILGSNRMALLLSVLAVMSFLAVEISGLGVSSPRSANAAEERDPEDITPKRGDLRISYALIGVSGVAYFVPIQKGATQAARDMGVQLDYKITQTADFEEQARLIDAAIVTKPDGLVVSLANPDALSEHVKRAIEAGIPTVVITDGRQAAKEVGALVFIGQDYMMAGREAGTVMKAHGLKRVACLNQAPGNVEVEATCSGFKQTFGDNVDSIPMNEADPTSMRNGVKAYLQANPDVDGLFALGSTSAEAAIDAVEDLGLHGKVQIGGMDLSEKVLEAIRDGKQLFAADHQQYLASYLALQTLVLYRQYLVKPGTDVIPTGPFFVTQENAAKIIDLSAKGYR